ncbi:MAG TPA: hypothetical protein VFO29_03175 [Candidatus Rubrimentiphilum sp.]|nr:hypothetical protein [Candidatus Rubrimentiphilum sp.]
MVRVTLERLGAVFVTAVLAYFLTLRLFFPGYIALPIPYHPDMYSAVDFASRGLNFASFLLAPRPLYFETVLFAGHFGLEGSLLFFDAIVLLDLALAIVLLERVVLHRRLPWLVVLGTLLLAMAGPGFYKQPGSDVGFHVALLCGLAGVCVWELRSQKHQIAALCLTALFFVLSVLANESLIPALVIYGVVAAFRSRASPAIAAALAGLPFLAIAASFGDSQLTHSPFVKISSAATYPYKIDLSLTSVLLCARYYVVSLFNAGFLTLLAVSAFGLWLRRRLKIAAILVVAALSLYLPYCVLPNHLNDVYQWVPMPLLMLLVPLAWADSPDELSAGSNVKLAGRVALALSLCFAIGFQSTQYLDQKHWTAVAIAQNRAVIDGLRSMKSRISAARSVLVTGLAFGRWPFMQSAAFLSHELNFPGEWTVTTEPGFPPINYQTVARPIDYGRIRWSDYDLIVVFNRDGKLAAAYNREQFRAEVARLGLRRLSNRGLVDLMNLYYPPGVIPPASAAEGARQGLYLDTAPDLCCFLNGSPSLQLRRPLRAGVVVFTFEVPHTAPFADQPERVQMFFNNISAGPPVTLTAGIHEVSFRLTRSLARSAQLTATMRMSVAYVPKQIGMNDDTRQLSIKLLRVDYRR